MALFGMTAKEWRESNPELAKNGNIRDYTDLLHLVILNNLQNTNAELIEENMTLIIVSHEEEFVKKVSDRVIELKNNKLKEVIK